MTGANTAGEARASQCEAGCPPRNRLPNGQHTDAAKRAADNLNLAIAAEGAAAAGKWMAIALADGSSDHALYPAKADAVAHQADEFRFAYFRVPRQWVTLCEAESFLRVNRMAYKAGFRLTDPREVIRPVTRADAERQIAQMAAAFGQRNRDG